MAAWLRDGCVLTCAAASRGSTAHKAGGSLALPHRNETEKIRRVGREAGDVSSWRSVPLRGGQVASHARVHGRWCMAGGAHSRRTSRQLAAKPLVAAATSSPCTVACSEVHRAGLGPQGSEGGSGAWAAPVWVRKRRNANTTKFASDSVTEYLEMFSGPGQTWY